MKSKLFNNPCHLTCIFLLTIIFAGCSSDHSNKLKGKVWANTDESFYGEYLWTFDTLGIMRNVNYTIESDNESAKRKYELNGNKISITSKGEKTEFDIDFNSDNDFILETGENKVNFRVANKQDSLVGEWENVNRKNNTRNFNSLKFHPDNKCEFSIDAGDYSSTLFGGNYKIEGNEIQLDGKEKSLRGGEKTFNDKLEIQILALDTVKVIYKWDEAIFYRERFQ